MEVAVGTVVDVPVQVVKVQEEDGSSGDYGEVEQEGLVKVKSEVNEEDKSALACKKKAQGSTNVQPLITPKVEENSRPVRANRGIKRRYPDYKYLHSGDESEDTDATHKPTRVRSMTEVFAESARYSTPSEQTGKEKGQKRMRAKKRGRPSGRANGGKKVVKPDENSDQPQEANVYVCKHEGCDKSFSEPGALYRHSRVHGDRPYVCHYEGCNRRFLERSKLKRHYLIHTGEKSFVCLYEGCGKAFSLDFNLRSHMKTHTGEYHECPHEGCEKKYCQNYKLRAHMCKDHNMVDSGNLNDLKKLNSETKAVTDKVNEVNPEAAKLARRQEKLQALEQRREKLDKWKDSRKKRIQELEIELERETRELNKVEKALKKLEREKGLLEADEESELESSDDSIEPDIIEQASEREVLLFSQKLQGDHGARLVGAEATEVLMSRPSSSEFGNGFLLSDKNSNNVGGSPNNNNNTVSNVNNGIKANGGEYSGSSKVNGGDYSGSNHKLLLLQQNELPVTHLFSFQEQPCLVD